MRQIVLISALVLVFSALSTQCGAQALVRQNIGAIGGSSHSNSVYVASAIGQPFDVSASFAGFQFTPGFIQPQRIWLEQAAQQLAVSVFPNPASNLINIQFETVMTHVNIRVTDVHGKLIHESTAINKSFYMIESTAWTKGTYFITLSSAQYKPQTTKLVIYH